MNNNIPVVYSASSNSINIGYVQNVSGIKVYVTQNFSNIASNISQMSSIQSSAEEMCDHILTKANKISIIDVERSDTQIMKSNCQDICNNILKTVFNTQCIFQNNQRFDILNIKNKDLSKYNTRDLLSLIKLLDQKFNEELNNSVISNIITTQPTSLTYNDEIENFSLVLNQNNSTAKFIIHDNENRPKVSKMAKLYLEKFDSSDPYLELNFNTLIENIDLSNPSTMVNLNQNVCFLQFANEDPIVWSNSIGQTSINQFLFRNT